MGTIKADTVTGLADPNKATIPNTITMGSTTATLNFGNTVITNASAGSTTVTAEGGSTTTNLQQGLAKVWCLCTQSTNSIFDSFNTSSIGDDGTGQIGFNFTNNTSGETYSAVSNTQVADCSGFNGTGQGEGSIETDEVTMQSRDNNGTDFDANPMAMTLHGDLA